METNEQPAYVVLSIKDLKNMIKMIKSEIPISDSEYYQKDPDIRTKVFKTHIRIITSEDDEFQIDSAFLAGYR